MREPSGKPSASITGELGIHPPLAVTGDHIAAAIRCGDVDGSRPPRPGLANGAIQERTHRTGVAGTLVERCVIGID